MALKPVTIKMEEQELDLLEREAKTVPRRSLSAYLRGIIEKRRKPVRQPMHSDD